MSFCIIFVCFIMHFIVHAALMRIKLMMMMIAVCCILANNMHLLYFI